jgi:hypothetical protein
VTDLPSAMRSRRAASSAEPVAGGGRCASCLAGSSGGPAKTYAYVQTYDTKPKRRLYELLRSQGMQDNQQVVFLTDGGEDIRDLPCYLNPQAEHYLDWFHITMRLTVLRQMTRSLPPRPASQHEDHDAPFTPDPGQVGRDLERVKNFLWHGNTFRALQILAGLRDDFDSWGASKKRPAYRQNRYLPMDQIAGMYQFPRAGPGGR